MGATILNLAWIEGDRILVSAPFNEERVKESRKIYGRRWNGEQSRDEYPLSSVAEVRALTERWGIPVTESFTQVPGYEEYQDMHEVLDYNVVAKGKHVLVSFKANPHLVAQIKSHIPHAEWKAKKGLYEAPIESLSDALKFAHEFSLTIEPEIEASLEERQKKERELFEHSTLLDWPEFEIPGLIKPLRPYQRAAVAYAQRVRRCIIADQQGLGKTAEAISTVVYDQSLPVLVVCKNRLKETIREDFLEFYPDLHITVLNGGAHKAIPESDVIIVNYDIVSQRLSDIWDHGFRSLIVDESHYIKNGKKKAVCPRCEFKLKTNSVNCANCGATKIEVNVSWSVRRTDATMRLAKSLPDEALVLLLTGTPINIRPAELIRQLECINRLGIFGGEWKFIKRYCPNNNTAINLKELNIKLRQHCFIRRKTQDVYGQLPPVQHSVQRMILTKEQMERYREVEKDVVHFLAEKARLAAELSGESGDIAYEEKYDRVARAEALVRINVLRGVTVQLKYEAMQEWVENFMESGEEKIVLFADRIAIVESFYEKFRAMSVKVRGGVSNTDALAATHHFQEDDWCRIFVANLDSAKEGFTLTKSSDVIFCEPTWAPTNHSQGVSRVYGRTNDPHGATAWWLLAPGTIDFEMFSLILERQKVVDAVTDGEDLTEEQDNMLKAMITMLEKKAVEYGV